MIKKRKKTLKEKMFKQICASRRNVILFSDFEVLGGVCQISRALKSLVEQGVIVRLGKGVYAKAEKNRYINRPTVRKGFNLACLEALDRLGVKYGPSRATRRYNQGESHQVPMKFKVRLQSRCRRSFAYGANKLGFEDGTNAK